MPKYICVYRKKCPKYGTDGGKYAGGFSFFPVDNEPCHFCKAEEDAKKTRVALENEAALIDRREKAAQAQHERSRVERTWNEQASKDADERKEEAAKTRHARQMELVEKKRQATKERLDLERKLQEMKTQTEREAREHGLKAAREEREHTLKAAREEREYNLKLKSMEKEAEEKQRRDEQISLDNENLRRIARDNVLVEKKRLEIEELKVKLEFEELKVKLEIKKSQEDEGDVVNKSTKDDDAADSKESTVSLEDRKSLKSKGRKVLREFRLVKH